VGLGLTSHGAYTFPTNVASLRREVLRLVNQGLLQISPSQAFVFRRGLLTSQLVSRSLQQSPVEFLAVYIILVTETPPMRIAFAGTPEFAACALSALLVAGHDVALVLTQPDRPSGRGMKLKASAVKTVALTHGIPVITPSSLSTTKVPEEAEQALSQLEQSDIDVLVVAAYGLILPERALCAAHGIGPTREIKAINIHASLLPRWRGAAPIQRAIEAGDKETGVCLMKMEQGLDTGPVICQSSIAIEAADTAKSLTEKLSTLGARLIVEALSVPEALTFTPQAETGVTYAKKLLKVESVLDWTLPADVIERRSRAYFPLFALNTALHGEPFKIWAVRLAAGSGSPGEVLESKKRLVVACGVGALECLQAQKAGKPVMDIGAFLQSFPIRPGDKLQ